MTAKHTIPLLNPFAETLSEIIEESPLSQKDFANACGIIPSHISEMKHGKRRITPVHDLRLSRFLGMSPGFFLRLQLHHDLELANRRHGNEINRIRPLQPA
jgi:addiction module HigA family antidote